MSLRFKSLCSGSSGNATLIEARHAQHTARLLVDCGMSQRQLSQRLAHCALAVTDLHAIFITHEHSDHIGSAMDIACRHRIPIWMSYGTYIALQQPALGDLLHLARDSTPFSIGDVLHVTPFTVPHDAREPLQITCTDGLRKLGLATDLGHASAHVCTMLQHCHALLLEMNHDPQLLAASRYPPFLKARIAGTLGHLSNAAGAALAQRINHPELGHVLAAHLSERNNRPELVAQALATALQRPEASITIATAEEGSPWLDV